MVMFSPFLFSILLGQISLDLNFDPHKTFLLSKTDGFFEIVYDDSIRVPVYPEIEGHPKLPQFLVNVVLPFGEKIKEIKILETKSILIRKGILPTFYTHQPPPGYQKDFEGNLDSSIYFGTTLYPRELISRSDIKTGYMAGYSLGSFIVKPFQWEPKEKALYMHTFMRLEIETEPNTFTPLYPDFVLEGSQEPIIELLKGIVENPWDVEHFKPPTQEAEAKEYLGFETHYMGEIPPHSSQMILTYIIITDTLLYSPYNHYAQFLRELGLPARVFTTQWIYQNYQGTDNAEKIRNFIKDAFKYWGVQYVLLGGDANLLPFRTFYQYYINYSPDDHNPPSDLYFACLDGNWNLDGDHIFGEVSDTIDPLPELFVGRVPSASSQEAWNYVNKAISYIITPGGDSMGFNSYYARRVLSVGADLFGGYEGPNYLESLIRLLPRHMEVYRLHQSPTNNNTLTQFINHLNMGMGLVMINTHATYDFFAINYNPTVPFNLWHVPMIYNRNLLPFILITACNVSGFDFTSIMEPFIKREQIGAIGILGASRLDWPTSGIIIDRRRILALHNNPYLTMGDFHYRQVYFWNLTYSANSTRYVYFTKILFGDPSIRLWIDRAKRFHVIIPDSAYLGLDTLEVLVYDDTDPRRPPVQEAQVIVYKENEVYSMAKTNMSGVARLIISPRTQGTMRITVQRSGFIPKTLYLPVVSGQRVFVFVEGVTVVDSNLGMYQGDSDGYFDAGEIVSLNVRLRNSSNFSVSGMWVKLRSLSPYAAVLKDSIFVTHIPPMSQIMINRAFDLVLTSNPSEGECKLLFLFSGNLLGNIEGDPIIPNASWSDTTRISIYNAVPKITRIHRKIVGDTLFLWPEIVNYGNETSRDVRIFVIPIAGVYEKIDTIYEVNHPLPPRTLHFDTTQPPIVLRGTVNALSGIREIWLLYEKRGFRDSIFHRNFEVLPPSFLRVEPVANGVRLIWNSNSPQSRRYILFRREHNSNIWERVFLGPHNLTYYEDFPLENAYYYYRLISIDPYFNSSPISDSILAISQFSLRAGFPVFYEGGGGESNHPKVADFIPWIPGKEIIFGTNSGRLYVITSSGAIAPGFPITYDGEIWSAPALGDIDNDNLLEVVIVTRRGNISRNKVFVYKPNASLAPGFPVTFEGGTGDNAGAYVPPLLIDLDNDGYLEIIIRSMNGKLFVWRYNGSSYIPGQNGYFAPAPPSSWSATYLSAYDLNLDSRPELIVPLNTTQTLTVYTYQGSVYPGFPTNLNLPLFGGFASGEIRGGLGYSGPEFVGVNDSLGVVRLYIFRSNGQIAEGFPTPNLSVNSALYTLPSLADIDGNGFSEILVNTNTGIKVYSGNGSLIYDLTFYDRAPQNLSQAIAVDLDHDGVLEVIANHLNGLIYAWKNGDIIPGFPIRVPELLKTTPVVDDIDGNGTPEIIVVGYQYVYVFNLPWNWNPTRVKSWPMIAHDLYNTSNVDFNFISPNYSLQNISSTHQIPVFSLNSNVIRSNQKILLRVNFWTPDELTVRLYTPDGRLLQYIDAFTLKEGLHQIPISLTYPQGTYFLEVSSKTQRKFFKVLKLE